MTDFALVAFGLFFAGVAVACVALFTETAILKRPPKTRRREPPVTRKDRT